VRDAATLKPWLGLTRWCGQDRHLTEGKPKLISVRADGFALTWSRTGCQPGTRKRAPPGRRHRARAEEKKLALSRHKTSTTSPGVVSGQIDGHAVLAGKRDFLRAAGVDEAPLHLSRGAAQPRSRGRHGGH